MSIEGPKGNQDNQGNIPVSGTPESGALKPFVDFTVTRGSDDSLVAFISETTADDGTQEKSPVDPKVPDTLSSASIAGSASKSRRKRRKTPTITSTGLESAPENKKPEKSSCLGCFGFAILAAGATIYAADALGLIDVRAELGLSQKQAVVVFGGEPNEPRDPQPPVTYPTVEPTSTPDPCQTVVVNPGDSYWKIAEQYLGNGRLYPTVQAQNPNSGGLEPGEELRVCADGSGISIPTVEPTIGPTEDPEARYQVPRLNRERLPADIVSRYELATRYHTRIHDAPGVNLHIRRGGVDLFDVFTALERKEVTSLDIVLVDAEDVKATSMTPEQRAELPDLFDQLTKDDKVPEDPSQPGIHAVGKYFYNKDGRLYIIVAAGGRLKPQRSQSYPAAGKFNFTQMQNYPIGGVTAAYILRHELRHFTSGNAKNIPMNNESLTDYLALEDIRQAEIQRAKGNNFLYSIIFETNQGNTVSQAPNAGDDSEILTINTQSQREFVPGMRADKIRGHSVEDHRARANARSYRIR